MKPSWLLLLFASTIVLCRGVEQPLEINPAQSRLRAEVRSTVHSLVAEVTQFNTDILVDLAKGKISRAQVDFNFAAVKTGDGNRDRDLLAWENSDSFPSVVFTLTSLEPSSEAEKFIAHGQLIFHGVTKALAFPVFVTTAGKMIYQLDGSFDLDTRDYGLPVIRRFVFLKVEPVVRISFQLEGRVAPQGK